MIEQDEVERRIHSGESITNEGIHLVRTLTIGGDDGGLFQCHILYEPTANPAISILGDRTTMAVKACVMKAVEPGSVAALTIEATD